MKHDLTQPTTTHNRPLTFRVRRITARSGTRYYMDGWPWAIPSWLRHLDGRSVRGVLAAVVVVAAFVTCGLGRLLGG